MAEIVQPDTTTEINGLTGNVTLAAGTNITLGTVGNTITINSSGGGGGGGTVTTDGSGTANYIPLFIGATELGISPDGGTTTLFFDGAGALNLSGTGVIYGDPVNGLTMGSNYIEGFDSGGNQYTIQPATVEAFPGSYSYVGGIGGGDSIAGNSFNLGTEGVVIQDLGAAHYTSIDGGSFNLQSGGVIDGATGNQASGAQMTIGSGTYAGGYHGGSVIFTVGGGVDSNGTFQFINSTGGNLQIDNTAVTGAKNVSFIDSNGTIPVVVSVPSTSTSTGIIGQIAYSSTYFYVCVATNSWKRIALSSF